MSAWRLVLVVLVALAAAGPAVAARPGYVMPADQLPPDVETARAMLTQSKAWAPPGTLTRRDIDYVLRLGDKYLQPGQPEGRQATVTRTLLVNAWWYTLHAGPIERSIIRDPDGILSTYWEGRGYAVNPVATAGRWQKLNAGLSPEHLAAVLLPYGVQRHWGTRRFTLWEYYDVPDVPGAIKPGASGMAQGRIAQLMARAYHRTGEARFADAARGALAAFRVPVNRGGVVSEVAAPGVPSRPWFVERAYPGASPWKGAALNGLMVTTLNLAATAPLLSSRPNPRTTGPREQRARPRARGARGASDLARLLTDEGERTLRRYLPLHDTGAWSLYGLLTPGYAWRTRLADVGYHCYHVRLLRQLNVQAPAMGFNHWADRWEGYARAAGISCARKGEIEASD